MRRILKLFVAVFLVLVSAMSASPITQVFGSQNAIANVSVAATRTVPLSLKIVFIGFNQSTINTTYLLWKENIPFDRVNQAISEPGDTGVVFELSYEFLFASSFFEKELLNFLRNNETSLRMLNPWFGVQINNTLYDANKLEGWLYANQHMYGGLPPNGYTFFVANLTQLPSVTYDQIGRPWLGKTPTPHYYNVEYYDLDLAYRIRNREFMTAWGGHHRFWFLDLSAGPSFNTPEDAPLQAVLTALEIDVNTPYGKAWLTEYLADYIWESVWNLAVPQFTHRPIYSEKYRIAITVFDNRTKQEKDQIPIRKTIRADVIKNSYRDLLPYSDFEVSIAFLNSTDDQRLSNELANAYKHSKDPELRYVDLRPIYKYLQGKLADYVANISRDEKEVTIPVFCFAFSKTYLGYTYKWDVMQQSLATDTLSGLAQEDMVICALTQVNELDRGGIVTPPQPNKGMGFSYVVVHEVGHMLGLMHPHQYGDVQDFVASAMSYFCHDYNFSQFDKDALRRMHSDTVIMRTLAKVAEARTVAETKAMNQLVLSKLAKSEELLAQAEEHYLSMDYVSAFGEAIDAQKLAYEALADVGLLPKAAPFWATLFLIVGVIIGCLIKRSLEKKLRVLVRNVEKNLIPENL